VFHCISKFILPILHILFDGVGSYVYLHLSVAELNYRMLSL
jgi:hypothetical protein